jgi:hypothetical protein
VLQDAVQFSHHTGQTRLVDGEARELRHVEDVFIRN